MCLETLTDESTMGPSNVQRSAIKYTLKNHCVVTIQIPRYCRFKFVKNINHGPIFLPLEGLFFKVWKNIGLHDLKSSHFEILLCRYLENI